LSSVYEPREDSWLLERCVRSHARGDVLDLGTGSGILALAALENSNVRRVTAVDINPNAIAAVQRRKAQLDPDAQARLVTVQSNMFERLEGTWDTIVCNPPYLPDDDMDTFDPALYGGPQGFEWTTKFLKDAKAHLAPNGQILLLFSNLTNRERIDLELKHLGYRHELIAELAQFFERLYVYRVWVA
jgi:release factor glutamine methyltransferase